jgi:hypothetical protein
MHLLCKQMLRASKHREKGGDVAHEVTRRRWHPADPHAVDVSSDNVSSDNSSLACKALQGKMQTTGCAISVARRSRKSRTWCMFSTCLCLLTAQPAATRVEEGLMSLMSSTSTPTLVAL